MVKGKSEGDTDDGDIEQSTLVGGRVEYPECSRCDAEATRELELRNFTEDSIYLCGGCEFHGGKGALGGVEGERRLTTEDGEPIPDGGRVQQGDDPDRLVQKIRSVLDIPDDEDLVVQTPQFERQDGVEPGDPPLTRDGMDAVKHASEDELKNLGLQKWSDDTGLWLLPHEWHPHIPEDYQLRSILDEEKTRADLPANPDKRHGLLSVGIVPEFERSDETAVDEAGTVQATWSEITATDLRNLSQGDAVKVCYDSVYGESRQTLEAEVAEVSHQRSVDERVTWVEVFLDLSDEAAEQIFERRRDTYRSDGRRRKLSTIIDEDGGEIALEARNGGRWHTISERGSVVVRGDASGD